MKRGNRQLFAAIFFLAVLVGCYFGAKKYSAGVEEKQQAEEAASINKVTDFMTEEVCAFSYGSAGLEVSFSLKGEEWKCSVDESLEIDTEKIESFLGYFNGIESESVIEEAGAADKEAYGFETPESSITVTFADGQTLTCAVGAYNDVMNVYYFKTDKDERIYTVDGSVVSKLSYTADNFVAEEEETESSAETEEAADEYTEE